MSWFDIALFSFRKHIIDLSFVSSKAIKIIHLPFFDFILCWRHITASHGPSECWRMSPTACLTSLACWPAHFLSDPEQSPAPSWFDSALPGNNWSVSRWLHLRVHNPRLNLMPRVYREWSHLPKPNHCQGQLYNAVATSDFHSQVGLESKNENAVKFIKIVSEGRGSQTFN